MHIKVLIKMINLILFHHLAIFPFTMISNKLEIEVRIRDLAKFFSLPKPHQWNGKNNGISLCRFGEGQ